MTPRTVIRCVLEGRQPPYVPWSIGLTIEARQKLQAHYGLSDVDSLLGNHFLKLGSDIGFFNQEDDVHFRDIFGVLWNRSIDKDIGNVEGQVLPRPALNGYCFPDPRDDRFFANIPEKIGRHSDRFRVFQIGFSLYERAWALRGMEPLLMDFHDHPTFVHELLAAIADYNIAQVHRAVEYDIDAVYFGDDWGQQRGLQMGLRCWREFIYPQLKRMYTAVRQAGKFLIIHSCGDVAELFDDLVTAGVNCFNPFQPEVTDVYGLLPRYRGRLAFYGGLSTQRTLPFGTPEQVRAETAKLLALGAKGGYIFAPAHDVEGDVPLENLLAMIEAVQSQRPTSGMIRRTDAVEDAIPRRPEGDGRVAGLFTSFQRSPCGARGPRAACGETAREAIGSDIRNRPVQRFYGLPKLSESHQGAPRPVLSHALQAALGDFRFTLF